MLRNTSPLICVVVLLLCASCRGGPARSASSESHETTARAAPKSIVVAYREAANIFEVLDNVSNWWEDKCEPEYRAYWEQHFQVSSSDERAFLAYREVRRRYYPQPQGSSDPRESRHGLFAERKEPDRFAEAFYASDSLTDAFARLRTFASHEDVIAVEAFFAAFQSRLQGLLAESRSYVALSAALESKLNDPKATAFAQSIARAYAVATPPRLTVLYVWWPPVEQVTANSRGTFLLMKYHPVKHAEGAAQDVDVPIHEFVHVVSAQRPDARKRVLTDLFLRGCDVSGKLKPVNVLEEPLAVAQQKLFLRETDPARLDFSVPWYGDPWVSTYAKLLVNLLGQHFSSGATVDEALMRRSARLCTQLTAVGSNYTQMSY